MIRWIIGSSIKSRRVVIVLAAVLVSFGVWHLRDLKVDALPEFGPTTVQIQTEAPGLAPAEVEGLVTLGMEHDLLNGIPRLAAIRSKSTLGLSSIDLIFEPGTDLLTARQVVQERLTQAHALPNVSKGPQMIQPLASTARTLLIGLSSRTLTPIEMGVLARWTVRPRLMGVAGVANVAIWGQRDQQLQVQVDPKALQAQGVSLDQVIHTTGNALAVSQLSFLEASTPGTGGFVDTPNQRLGIEHILPISRPEELAQVPLDEAGAEPAKLGDVATVVQDHQPLIGDSVGPTLMLVVEKLPGANTIEVTKAVDEAMEALKPGLPGVTVDSSLFRPARYVQTGIDNVIVALLVGGVLLLLALAGLLFDWRRTLVSFAAIVCSLAAAVSVLYLRAVTVNAMVLAGLVVALVVVIDDAMDAQTLAGRLGRQRREEGFRPSAALLEASGHLRSGLGYAALISAVTVVPVLLLRGGPGEAFLPPIVLTYLLVVAASMLVALTVAPALSMLLLGRSPAEPRPSPVLGALRRLHDRVLSRMLPGAGMAIAAGAVMLAAAAVVLPGLRASTAPVLKDRDVSIHVEAVAGTSLPEMTRLTDRMTAELRSLKGVSNVGAQVGRAVTSDTARGVDAAGVWATIDRSAPYDPTLASIRTTVAGYPGLHTSVATYETDRTGEVLTGSADPVVVRVYGTDYQLLQAKAADVKNLLSGVRGVVGPKVTALAQEPSVEVQVDIPAAQRYGVKPGDVRREATALVQGIEAGSIFEAQKVFDVVVKGNAASRSSLTGIQDLLIDTPSGGHVRLGDVASVRIVPAPSVISHDATKRSIDVTAGLIGRGLGAVSADIKARLARLQMPSEYHAELLADAAVHQGAELRVIEFGVAAAIMLLLLLQAAYGSWRLAALSFLALPVALTGGVLAARIDGGTVSLGSIAGFFAVFAIAVRACVLLIRHYRRLEQEENQPFGPELVLRGTGERLPPTVMTAAAAGMALLPLLVRGSVAGLEIVHPAAVVILGGLLSSTLLTMLVLPPLYLRFGSSPFGAGASETGEASGEAVGQVAVVTEETPQGVPQGVQAADPTFLRAGPQEQP
jgi:Cu/Ag efflux pump CusA